MYPLAVIDLVPLIAFLPLLLHKLSDELFVILNVKAVSSP